MHVVWTLATRLLMVAYSVGSGIIVARWLGAEGLGVYAVLGVTINNAVQMGGSGLTAANIYFTSQNRRILKPVAVNALIFALAGGGVIAFGITGLASHEPTLFRSIPLKLVAIAAAAIPFQMIILFGLNVFLTLGLVKHFNLLEALGQSFILLNAVLALVIWGAGLLTLIPLNTAACVAVSVLISWMVYRHLAQQKGESLWRPDASLFGRMLRYGIKFNASMTATMLVFRADVLIVNYFRGTTEAGIYSVASQGGLLLMLLPNVIGTLLFPRVASMRDERGEFTSLVTRHTAFVMALVCLAAA
ncbi:MAG TPA: oligosaccharide flippase family protein, partial [Pyrinomonadaceae bacterium]|nr:oligosaccharide flippase family protein [Pyrinomonadaceae bacterium]